jgi:hypothetical protein
MDKNILGTNIITQVAILVNDIEKSCKEFADFFGVENPGYIITDGYEKALTEYKGKKCDATAKLAFFNAGPNVTIELIEPDQTPSVWRDDLNKNGEGVHHIAFNINGMKQIVESCEKNGFKLLQKGEYTGGRYSYIDTEDVLKVKIELLEND